MKETETAHGRMKQTSDGEENLAARETFFRVVDNIQEKSKDTDPQAIETVIAEVIAEVEAQHKT